MSSDKSIETIFDDLQSSIGVVVQFLDDNPGAKTLVTTALVKLQELIREAQGFDQEPVKKPLTADDLRKMIHGITKDLKASQSPLEKFIQWSLESSEAIVALLASLAGIAMEEGE